ncbi:MAG TPA: hypothetical protein VGM88_18265 [Kofleriaceae bacterium]
MDDAETCPIPVVGPIDVEIDERAWPLVTITTHAPLRVATASRLVVRLTRWCVQGAPFGLAWVDKTYSAAPADAAALRLFVWWLARYRDDLRTCCAGIALVPGRDSRPQLLDALPGIADSALTPLAALADASAAGTWLRSHLALRGWLAYCA